MPLKRFLFFWLADYLLATLVVYTLSAASVAVFHLPQLAYVVLLFIPVSTLCFSWLFYRKLGQLETRRLVVASVWVVLAMVVDGVVGWMLTRTSPLLVVTSPLLLAVYGTKFLAVFVGAYVGLNRGSTLRVADDMLSPR